MDLGTLAADLGIPDNQANQDTKHYQLDFVSLVFSAIRRRLILTYMDKVSAG